MEQLAIGLLVFVLRITDVSIGTMRVLYTVRGRRLIAACLGFMEAGVFIVAISRVFKHIDNPLSMLGYAAGFAVGTILGITVEKWIAAGSVLLRVISRDQSAQILAAMRQRRFGVTSINGEGRNGPVLILFLVIQRKRATEAMRLIEDIDPEAFVTTEAIGEARGGYLPLFPGPAAVRK
jgi:uncharacterized protein YebE (UPF0316 family)